MLIWQVGDLVNRQKLEIASVSQAGCTRWWADLRRIIPVRFTRRSGASRLSQNGALAVLAGLLSQQSARIPAAVAQIIQGLSSDDFRVREKASREELRHVGELAVGSSTSCQKGQYARGASAAHRRVAFRTGGPGTRVPSNGASRAVAALERIGGSEVQELLARLATGA